MRTILKAAIGAALAFVVQAPPAAAQFLTFVSAAGNDANTCFVQANPCQTLQRAINQTSPGGEVRLLTSLTSNGFINKSITIEGGYNTAIGAFIVNGASAVVRFRRLNLNGRNAFPTGFDLRNAAAIHIEECSVERYAGDGIRLADNVSTELSISDSVIRDNGSDGLDVIGPTNAKVSIGNSRLSNNLNGAALRGGQAFVSRSIASGNVFHGFAMTAGTINLLETASTAHNNGNGFFYVSGAEVTLESCLAADSINGLFVEAASARISNCVFTDNSDDGVDTNNGVSPITKTLGNNLMAGNAGSNLEGALTPLAPE